MSHIQGLGVTHGSTRALGGSVPACCFFLLCLLLASGNASAKSRDEKPPVRMKRVPLPSVIVTNHTHIPTAWKFNPVWWFKNYDHPEPPDWMWPGHPNRHFKWYWRNPLNNFTFYVIGIADKTFVRVGPYPDRTFSPRDGWNWAVCRYEWLRLPIISYHRGKFFCYIGWRGRGNFGIEFKFAKPKEEWLRENQQRRRGE
jgi:hypothetical protein